MKKHLVMTHESASVDLKIWDDGEAMLSNLFSRAKNQGHASELMRKVVAYADKNQLTLFLEAQRWGRPPNLDNQMLRDFYVKFGFELEVPTGRKIFMVRKPSQELHGL